jgi:hypothetical protein
MHDWNQKYAIHDYTQELKSTQVHVQKCYS